MKAMNEWVIQSLKDELKEKGILEKLIDLFLPFDNLIKGFMKTLPDPKVLVNPDPDLLVGDTYWDAGLEFFLKIFDLFKQDDSELQEEVQELREQVKTLKNSLEECEKISNKRKFAITVSVIEIQGLWEKARKMYAKTSLNFYFGERTAFNESLVVLKQNSDDV